MKYMFASDVHGSAYYCRLMLEKYKEEQAERLVLLGDLLYHGPRNDLPKEYAPKEVIKMMNGMKNDIYAVRGNCEAEVDQMVLEFPVMADYCILNIIFIYSKSTCRIPLWINIYRKYFLPFFSKTSRKINCGG